MARSLLFVLALAAGVQSKLTKEVEKRRSSQPRGWNNLGRAPPDHSITLSFFLEQPAEGVAQLEAELLERSDPKSESYSQWLSNDQVHALVAPSSVDVALVTDFISSFGAEAVSRTPNSDVITTTVSIATAEKMLNAQYNVYQHDNSKGRGELVTRTLGYSLPVELPVAFVGPTTHFARQNTFSKAMDTKEAAAQVTNDPDNLRALYNVDDVLGGTAPDNKQAVTAFLGQYYKASDLEKFWSTQFPAGTDTPIKLVGDATTGNRAGVESMLDIEYMPALGALNPTEFWGYSGRSPLNAEDEPFLTWLYAVGNTSDAEVPQIFSTSYGEDEPTEAPSSYAARINVEFMKCGSRGISLLFASGDSGAASDAGSCTGGPDGNQFMPMWPAASPYVTAVGGVTNGAMPESAWSGSSGGFSNIYDQPSWQTEAIATFLDTAAAAGTLPPTSYFNSTGRGFPDIAAQSVSYPVVANGITMSVAGTSCASPCSGGIFGLLNDARLSAGKTSLGFLNPMLYANAAALNDCTQGVQGGCSGVDGFPAVEGWDAVTGLGSPNYTALLEVVMALP